MLKVLQGFQLIDGTGRGPLEDACLVIDKDKITQVGKGRDIHIPHGAEIIDLKGKTVLPGLIDAHVHLFFNAEADPISLVISESETMSTIRAVQNAAKTLRGGVTTVRDLGCPSFAILDLKNAINQGIVPGPRIVAAGQFLTMTGGHAWSCGLEADGPAELRKSARQQLKAGVDLLKLMATASGGVKSPDMEPGSSQLSEDEMKAAIDEANKVGKRSAAHAQGTSGIKSAIRAGVTSIEHGMFLDKEAVTMMLEHQVYFVPTLSAPYWPSLIKKADPELMLAKKKEVAGKHQASFRLALNAGVKIVMGTDAGTSFNEHGNNHMELRLMVQEGMTPLDAITAATKRGAELLDLADQLGTIEKGKQADLLILNRNPLLDMSALNEIHSVFKAGEVVV